MKKRITSWLLMLILVLGLLPAVVSAAPKTGGSGTEADPYLIATEEDLAAFRDEVNASADKSTSNAMCETDGRTLTLENRKETGLRSEE